MFDLAYYLKHGGVRCPYTDCHSYNIETNNPSFYENAAYIKVNCHACERTWEDKYVLQDAYERGA